MLANRTVKWGLEVAHRLPGISVKMGASKERREDRIGDKLQLQKQKVNLSKYVY